MTTTTTINAGQQQIVTAQEGQALSIVGASGASGVVYRMNDTLGGGNSLQSWPVGSGALAAIGPFPGVSRFLIVCSVGSIAATVAAAVLSLVGSGVGAVATITGNYAVGQALTAAYPAGVVGTIQFTRTLQVSPFTKANIASAVASAVNSLSYTLQQADAAYSVAVDCSNQVSPSLGGVVASVPGAGTLRQVSTGTFLYDSLVSANFFAGCTTEHVAAEHITSIKPVFTNWWVKNATTETNGTASATIAGAVEYPMGTKTPFTYSGVARGICPAGQELLPDDNVVDIPAGATYLLHLWQNNPGGILAFQRFSSDGNAKLTANNVNNSNQVPDLTLAGSTGSWGAVGTRNAFIAGFNAVVANSTREAVGVLGDSISVGTNDTTTAGQPFQGHLGRAFKGQAYGHLGTYGDTIQAFLAGSSKRVAFAKKYFTRFVLHMGINDVTSGRTAAQIQADTNSLAALYAPSKLGICTLMPVSTSTDGWTTTGNQIASTATPNAVRAAVNAQRKTPGTLASNIVVVYDLSPQVENTPSPEDSIWKANYTTDGTHPENSGYVPASTVIDAAAFVAM